jgi:hypothetical protein
LISGVDIGCVAVCLLAVAIFFLFRRRQTDASEIVYEMGYETEGKVKDGDNLDFNEEEDMSFADTIGILYCTLKSLMTPIAWKPLQSSVHSISSA